MLIGITPGSIALDVSDDRSTMYVHTMFADDPDRARQEIKNGLERRVLELLR
jgi:multicomponent Na+:H+ antiporter subunit E